MDFEAVGIWYPKAFQKRFDWNWLQSQTKKLFLCNIETCRSEGKNCHTRDLQNLFSTRFVDLCLSQQRWMVCNTKYAWWTWIYTIKTAEAARLQQRCIQEGLLEPLLKLWKVIIHSNCVKCNIASVVVSKDFHNKNVQRSSNQND